VSDLAERLQILHACWTVNSGTPSGDKYADDLAEAMLDNAEAIIAALDSHADQSAELAKLREDNHQLRVHVENLQEQVLRLNGRESGLRADAERKDEALREAAATMQSVIPFSIKDDDTQAMNLLAASVAKCLKESRP